MLRPRHLVLLSAAIGLAWPAWGQAAAPGVPPANEPPILRLEGDGPLSPVSAVAFGPDGGTLYEAGWDKVVRVWKRDPVNGRFAVDPSSSLRTPIGPGDAGVLNALAVSPDGSLVAVGGNAALSINAGFRQNGLLVPRASLADPWDQGVIYVFDMKARPAKCRQIRAHPGAVQALTFSRTAAGAPPVLVSAGSEPGTQGDPNRRNLVLRAWDAASGTAIGAVVAGEYRKFRPWLAAWSLPQDPARTRVASAWADSSHAVWDVGTPQPRFLADPFDGRSLALTYRPDKDELLTGHFGKPPAGAFPEGYLATWSENGAKTPARQQVLSWAGTAPSPPNAKAMPVAQALVSSKPGGPPDLLAVVLQGWNPPDPRSSGNEFEYRLHLLDLDPAAFGTARARVNLWTGPRVQPFAASSPDGSQLAVVGNSENEILVYDVARFLQDPPRALQTLRGAGESIGTATFVRKADNLGLRLRHVPQKVRGALPPPIGPEDAIFDLTGRGFSPSTEGWSLSNSAAGSWSTRLEPPGPAAPPGQPSSPWYLWVYEDRKPVTGIPFYPDSASSPLESVQVTDFALRPPIAQVRDPVVAVALAEPGIGPTLWLYNGRTGERFRQLNGHTGAIRSLDFSVDGRFLVSSADDRTVCVWSLTDLDRILGVRGALPGLILTRRNDQRYVVAEVRRGPFEGRDTLRVGDVIEGIVEKGQLRVPGSVLDIHVTAGAGKPGQGMTLRRSRGGEGPRDVTLVLGQGVDERKPLFTLFVNRPGAGQNRDWLAWNPFGPYDASGPGIESLCGWHFNEPDQPQEPARFALMGEYPKFRRNGLLRDLIDAGRLPPPPAPVPIAPPEMELMLDPESARDGKGRLVARQIPTALNLLLDPRLSAERIDSVTWRLDDGQPASMRLEEMFWSADLSGFAWDRVPHKVTLELRTKDPAQSFTKNQVVRYLPRPPRLLPRGAAAIAASRTNGLDVEDRRFRFLADVELEKGVTARVRLICRHDDQTVSRADFGPDFAVRPIDAKLELKPGANTIELEAVNEGTRPGFEGEETSRLGPLTVNYHPRPVSPPTVTLDAVALLPESPGKSDLMLKVEGTDLGVVELPRIRLEGRIAANVKLRSADWQHTGGDWKLFDGFVPGTQSFAFRLPLDLVEGRQTIRLRARAGFDESEADRVVTLTVDYRPRVPTLVQLAAEAIDPLTSPGTGGGPPRVKLTAKVVGSQALHPVDRAVVRVDDEPLSEPPSLDRDAGTFSAIVGLPAGTHQLRVELSNRWGTALYGPIVLKYSRPPLLDLRKAELSGNRPFAAISARVASSTPLTKTEFEVVSRSTDPPTRRVHHPRMERIGDVWEVSGEVPLDPGENEVIVRAWNEDGPSPEVSRRLVFTKPVEPKPEVLVLTQETVVRRPVFAVRFRVRSAGPLTRVELFRTRMGSAREPVRSPFELNKVERRPDGFYESVFETGITLEPYQNTFEVVAESAGGESSADVTLSYAPPPVRVEIVGVESDADPGHTAVPRTRMDGPPTLPAPLAGGRGTIHGRVVWADADPRAASQSPRVQIWVNGFPQVAAVLGPVRAGGQGLVREFQTAVLLTRSENEVVVKLRDAPLDIHGSPKLAVACRAPDKSARLHLWIIALNEDDERALLARAVAALKGRITADGKNDLTVSTPAFPVTTVYGPEAKGLTRSRAYSYLKKIAKNIPIAERPSNDVVMIYYEGGEVIEGDRTSLRLNSGGGGEPSVLFPLSELRRHLSETRGAKLFLFDVTHAPDQSPLVLAESARWVNDDSPFGLLTVCWPGESRPAGTNLAVALAQALKTATTIGEASEEMGKQTVAWRRQAPGLQYRTELPSSVSALIIGGP